MSIKENICLNEDIEFNEIIRDIVSNETVQKMKEIPQHGGTNCFDHCYNASYYCYKICKKLNLDYISAARAAMVHDLFLYNWRDKKTDRRGLHGFTHPRVAYENASKLFDLNEKEKDIILKHMWPLTIVPPKCLEGFILTIVDKYCATTEFITNLSHKKLCRYAYLIMFMLFIKK